MMGAGNVKAAFEQWAPVLGVSPAFQVLAFMALTSLDDARPPTYFGGRDRLAAAIGRTTPHAADDYRAVRRAVQKLEDVGAIERSRQPAPGRTAAYSLNLRTGVTQRPPNRGHAATSEQGSPGDRTGVTQRPPEEEGGVVTPLPPSTRCPACRHSRAVDGTCGCSHASTTHDRESTFASTAKVAGA